MGDVMTIDQLLLKIFLVFGLLFVVATSTPVRAESHLIANLQVTNPLNETRIDASVLLPLALFANSASNSIEQVVVMENGHLVTTQAYASELEQAADSLLLVTDFLPSETKYYQVYSIINGLPHQQVSPETYAELAVRVGGIADKNGNLKGGEYLPFATYRLPASHKIGDKLFKYEGLGWESEHIAYRYYYDNRGAIDVFGKIESALALKQVGLDGDDYHKLNDWGMDVLKVGKSVGVGALAANELGKITNVSQFDSSHTAIHNGALMSEINLWHKGWLLNQGKQDLHTRLRIIKGSALTQVSASTAQGMKNFATGVVNHQVEIFKSDKSDQQWCYLATFGKQSLAEDNLGLGIFFECKERQAWLTTEDNVAVLLTQQKSQLNYYLFAKWSAEPNGIQTSEQFQHYLDNTVQQLNHPLSVKVLMQ
jgi:hypothetical protein